MDHRKDFIIHFTGLSIGNHQFEFEVDDTFFESYEYSELHHGKVRVDVDLEKQERMLLFSFQIEGSVEVTCDRCGEEFMLPLSGTEQLIVKFGNEYAEENADIITIPATDYKFDLSPFLYEYLHLMLPSRILHPDDENGNTSCNPEVLKRLEQLAPHPSTDPRWDALSRLKNGDHSENSNQ